MERSSTHLNAESRERSTFGDQLRELINRNTQGEVELLGRLTSLLREPGRGVLGDGPGPDAREVVERGVGLLFDWYATMSRHRLAFLNEALSALERSLEVEPRAVEPSEPDSEHRPGAQTETSPSGPETDPVPELFTEALPGQSIVSRFLLENHYPYPLTVTFRIEATGPHDGELPADWVSFHPEPLLMEPQSRALAEARIEVPEDVEAGIVLRAAICLHGFQARRLVLCLRVLEPGAATEAPADAPAKKVGGAKKNSKKASGAP